MITQLNHTDVSTAKSILHVQKPAYDIEAKRIQFDGIPALQDTAETIQKSKECFLGYTDSTSGRLAGVLAYDRTAKGTDITRLVVHPDFFRGGIASALLAHLLQLKESGPMITVSTGAKNAPAVRLYEKHHFTRTGDAEVAPGFFITHLQKALKSV
ncbi:GNAT family N-acetyltransferase [Aureibacillus halotolerans]|uniref:Ribosomal protein S18 acetylase RimI-like enzyme n=1 Tax=Aureibacillus halotolerans TaxID=1508390 RepID=A0A4R6UCT7_9BACI|nr:GNAT family N-acetyltransferase [Aureibacillus halotolerans]TDQ42575.1 ribosomal protein S18 acetylase RimI-like enzyme [Aureibacillus halotolerans]